MLFNEAEWIIIYMLLTAMGTVVFFVVYYLIPKPLKR